MCDFITIDNLEVFANHGVLKEENSLGQKFLVCAKLYFDMDKAASGDDISESVNYAEICSFITRFMRENTFKLIEKVANNIAIEMLARYELLQEVEITVKKPWAPIGLSVDSVMVTVTKKWNRVYFSIGSNMGDKEANLDYAVEALKRDGHVKVKKVSSYLTTKPYGGVEQDDFLNAAIEADTLYSPQMLLEKINTIEKERDRKRDIHWGPRTLDIDILLYNNSIINSDNLVIPHPDMVNRDFVLEPMNEIAPYVIHPVKKMSMQELLAMLKSK